MTIHLNTKSSTVPPLKRTHRNQTSDFIFDETKNGHPGSSWKLSCRPKDLRLRLKLVKSFMFLVAKTNEPTNIETN